MFTAKWFCTNNWFACLLLVFLPSLAIQGRSALPSGMQVVQGQVDASSSAGVLRLDQLTPQAIANWESFSIGIGQRVLIQQLGADSVLLNRVMGANPSELMGQLDANGRVFLINPNGIVVGRDASINTAQFMASALNITDAEFIKGGDLLFAGESTAPVLNLGRITASNGDVILIGHRVVNSGEILAPNGVAALAAGNEVLFTPEGNQRILVKTTLGPLSEGTGVDNSGLIEAAQAELKASGGSIYELAVNQSGFVRATGVERRDGRVLLTAGGGRVVVSGEITAQNADGSGGDVRIGGGFYGADPTIPNAQVSFVSEEAIIDVSATAAKANAGTAVVWADGATYFGGTILGQGGAAGGDGAQVEVSGARHLDFRGVADLAAPFGQPGLLLLDPVSLEIVASGTESDPITLGDPFTFGNTDIDSTSILLVSTLENQLSLGDVELITADSIGGGGSIMVSDPISWTSGNRLTFTSGDSIFINASINAGTGNITFELGGKRTGSAFIPTIDSELIVASTVSITANSIFIQSSSFGFGPMGRIQVDGMLDVNRLTISYPQDAISQFGGIEGTTTIANPNNRIGVLEARDGGLFKGDLTVVDSQGGLTLEGEFIAGLGAAINISTVGDLTLASGARLTTGIVYGTQEVPPFSNIYLAARGGTFNNQAGPDAVFANGTGRFLIYSATPSTINKGGLVGNPVYNKRFDTDAPASITATGNRFLYELAPVLTFTAAAASRDYGDPNPTFSFTFSGLVPGDTAEGAFTGSPTVSSALTATSNAGVYPTGIEVGQGALILSDFNYGFAGVAGALTINKVELSVTPNPATRLYGDPDPIFSGTFVGFRNDDTVNDLTTAPTFTPSSTITSPVGTYNLTASGAASPNYTFSYQPGTNLFTITPAPLLITANPATRLYGANNPTFSATLTGIRNDETASVLPGLTFATPDSTGSSNVGTGYIIRPSGATNANYIISYADGALTINPAPLQIRADNESILVGDDIPDPSTYTATFTGLVAGDIAANYFGQLSFLNEAQNSSTVGDFAITPFGVTDPNYTITFADGILSIGTRLLTIRANDTSRVYGQDNPDFTATFSGFINDDDASVFTSPLIFSTTATVNSPVAATYQIVPSGATADNYTISFLPGTLTITPASLLIRANNASRLFQEGDPTFGATFIGLTAGDTEGDILGLTFSTNASAASPVGSNYFIRPANASNPNYTISFEDGVLTINPAPLQITANDASREFGAADPIFSASFLGLLADDTASVVSGLNFATNAVINSPVGTNYTITPFGASSLNYAFTYVNGRLSITPASLIITANNSSRIYGDENPVFSATFDGLRAGDQATDFTTLAFTTAPANATVGRYDLTVSGAVNPNYAISYQSGFLDVLTRAVQIVAPSFSLIYGNTVPALQATISGLASFDTAGVLGPLVVTAPRLVQFSNVGNYTTIASGASNPNYAITFLPGEVNVTPRSASITANNAARLYGDPNPAFTAFSTGIFETDFTTGTVTFSTPAVLNSNVGTYAITPSAFSNPNYSVTFVNGELTISPAPLTVTLGSASRFYGDLNPELGFTVSGLKVDDTAAVLTLGQLNTGIGPASPVGTYAATYETATAANYDVSVIPGTISITPRPIKIEAANAERIYGDPNPAFAIANTDTNLLPELDPVNQVLRFSTNAARLSLAGNYAITPELLNSNYTLTAIPGTLTVTPRPLDIVIDSFELIYGDPIPDFTFRVVGLGLPEGVTSLEGQIVLLSDLDASQTANGRFSAGFYPIDRLNTEFLNPRAYTLASVQPGMLKIAPRPIGLAFNTIEVQFPAGTRLDSLDLAGMNFPLAAEAFGLLPGDTLENVFPDLMIGLIPGRSLTLDVVDPSYVSAFFNSPDGRIVLPTTPVLANRPSLNLGFLAAEGLNRVEFIAPLSGYLPNPSLPGSGRVNRNYAVTTIRPGALVATRPFVLTTSPAQEAIIAMQLNPEPLRVISEHDYRNNFGIFLNNHPHLGVSLIFDYLSTFLLSDDDSDYALTLLTAIAGDSAESIDDITPEMIALWLSDISTNGVKRQIMSGVIANYAMDLQRRDPSTYSAADSQFVSALNAEMVDQRRTLVASLAAKRDDYLAEKASSGVSQLQSVFGEDIPYDQFLADFMMETFESITATDAAIFAAGQAVVGGAAAGTVAGVAAAAHIIVPYRMAQAAKKAASAAAKVAAKTGVAAAATGKKVASTALGASLGPFIAVVIVVEVSIIRGIQIAKNEAARIEFETFLDPSTGGTNLATLKLDPEDESIGSVLDRMVLLNSIYNML